MKSKLFITCMLALMVGMPGAFSAEPKNYADIIRSFISAHVNSNPKELNSALDDDATFKIPRQDKLVVQHKSDLVKALSQMEGVKQNCTSSYQLIAKTDALVLARVDFKYPEFVQHNYITIERTDGEKWKITDVCKISENNSDARAAAFPIVTAVD